VECEHCGEASENPSESPSHKSRSGVLDDADTILSENRFLDEAGTVLNGAPRTLLGGRYELLEELGRGGMGVVYKARDKRLNSIVAVKLLSEQLEQDLRGIELLKREARTAMKLSHPNIVKLHTYEEHPEGRFLVMEYVEGRTLAEVLFEKKRLSGKEIKKYGVAICKGLEHAHSERVIHRDMKPSNIMIDKKGRIKIADFGIARILEDAKTRQTGEATSGTLLYMSPEQIMGHETDARSDIYSLGITLYELLNGEPPFTTGDISMQHLRRRIKPIPDVSERMNLILQKCCAKKPECRFRRVKQLRAALLGKYDMETMEPSGVIQKDDLLRKEWFGISRIIWLSVLGFLLVLAIAAAIMYPKDSSSTMHPMKGSPESASAIMHPMDGSLESAFDARIYFPLNVGDTRTYESSNGTTVTRSVTGAEEICGRNYAVIERSDGNKSWWLSDEKGGWLGKIQQPDGISVAFCPEEQIIDNNSKEGYSKSTQYKDAVIRDASGKQVTTQNGVINVNFKEIETVTTPAGIFKDCAHANMVVISWSEIEKGRTTVLAFDSWFAEGIGVVKEITETGEVLLLERATVGGIEYSPETLPGSDFTDEIFTDDFEDGRLNSSWFVYDGSVNDTDESDGVLHLSGPDSTAKLFGDVLMFKNVETLSESVAVTATFEAINPPPTSAYGILVGKLDLKDNANLALYNNSDTSPAKGTMIAFTDETVYNPPNYPALAEVDIPEFKAGERITLRLVKDGANEVTAYYSMNGTDFTQVGSVSAETSDPFTVGVFGENYPPTALGTGKYEFRLLEFETLRP